VKWLWGFLFFGLSLFVRLEASCENFLSRIHDSSFGSARDLASAIPIGVSAKDFESFLKFLEVDPIFADAESIIIYGSRTNHSEGILPESESDLDIRILWKTDSLKDDLNLAKQLERVQNANQALETWSKKLGFKVSVEIPSFVSLSEFLQDLHPMHRAIFEMKKLGDRLSGLTEEERTALKIKINAILVRYRLPINPGAIFILKGEATSSTMQERLKALGVRKMILLN